MVKDLEILNKELLPKFRARDFDAKRYQRQYRQYQIGYMLLAALATMFGALLALAQSGSAELVAFFGFCETVVALFTTYLATISGRETPLPEWLANRHRAETLRREYFRFLMNLEPYATQSIQDRERLLSMRAALIDHYGTTERKEQVKNDVPTPASDEKDETPPKQAGGTGLQTGETQS